MLGIQTAIAFDFIQAAKWGAVSHGRSGILNGVFSNICGLSSASPGRATSSGIDFRAWIPPPRLKRSPEWGFGVGLGSGSEGHPKAALRNWGSTLSELGRHVPST